MDSRIGTTWLVGAAVVAASCASDGGPATDAADTANPGSAADVVVTDPTSEVTTTAAAPPSTIVETTTTTAATTTTEPPLPVPEALQQYNFPVSDEWVVETVVADIDSGTGGLAIDANGVMYVGDFGQPDKPGTQVRRIQPDGTIDAFATAEGMRSLTMTTFGADGTMYQSSYGSDEVYTIDAEGNATLLTSSVRSPTGLAPLDDGSVLVASYGTAKIFRVAPDGEASEWVASRRFRGLNSLALGPDGTVYAADHRDGQVFAIPPDGEVELLVNFPKPTSHVAYLDGSLFVTSRGAYLVFRYDLATGDVEIIAGNGEPGDADGRGVEASFGRPNAITVGPDGALYMNHGDGDSNFPVTIRRISHQP
ncbi:MAG: hypothetical protein HKN44_09250 [Ilumatobacter sp.]|nr:hypothetical protein [Ilumatobacter sp.]